jgi:hypothetical protein
MENIQLNEGGVKEAKSKRVSAISLWSRSGPVLLLLSFAIFLFKSAPLYWPLTLTVFLGYAAVRLWNKGGLLLSLVGLSGTCIVMLSSGAEALWTVTLCIAVALSLLLIYLGGVDSELFYASITETLHAFDKERSELKKQLQEFKCALSKEQWHYAAEKQQLLAAHARDKEALAELLQSLQDMKQQGLRLSGKCEALESEVSASVGKESVLKSTLKEAEDRIEHLSSQVAKLSEHIKSTKNPDESSNEDSHIAEVRFQLNLLRGQFEEKSEALDLARKDLFRVENDLLLLQKVWEEKMHEPSEEVSAFCRDLKLLEKEIGERENQILILQDIIDALSTAQKAPAVKRRKKKSDEQSLLPGLIQRKIDRKSTGNLYSAE